MPEKNSSDSTGDAMKFFYQLLLITLSVFIGFQPNFDVKWAIYSTMNTANLAQISGKGGLCSAAAVAVKKNTKKF